MLSTPTCVLSISGDRAIAVTLARRAASVGVVAVASRLRSRTAFTNLYSNRKAEEREREREREDIYAYIYIGVHLCLAASPVFIGAVKGDRAEKRERK